MSDPIVMTLTMIIVGQICLSVPLLLTRANKSPMCLPLALFLLASGILAMNSVVSSMFGDWYVLYTALAFPTLFILCPSLWFYVEGITSSVAWKLHIRQVRHYVLLWPALVISVMVLFLPKDLHTAIFIDDVDVTDPFAITLVVSILVMMLLWLGQCVYTVFCIISRLRYYRKKLKDMYSNNESKELNWMNWLLFVAASTWLFSLVTVFSSNLLEDFLFNIRTEALLSLLLIWSLTHFGLQQQPELIGHLENDSTDARFQDQDRKINEDEEVLSEDKKYQRSALSAEQSNRIAEKIKVVMKKEQLYLDSSLSLQKLARYTAISPNYISQTLNETLSINFFDFVNQWRIEAAKPKILANQDTVFNIALEVGFNARSSFYKAFKQETGKTPSEFRKNHVKN